MKPSAKAKEEPQDGRVTLLNQVFGAQETFYEMSYQLESLADALHRMGMDRPADELTYMARKLNAVGKALVEAHGEAQSAALRESSSQVHSLFSLILSTTISPHDPKTRGTP